MCFPHKGKTSSGSPLSGYWVSCCPCWGGKRAEFRSLALAAPSSQAPTKPPLLALPCPHSSMRSSSGAWINFCQCVLACHLGELVTGKDFFPRDTSAPVKFRGFFCIQRGCGEVTNKSICYTRVLPFCLIDQKFLLFIWAQQLIFFMQLLGMTSHIVWSPRESFSSCFKYMHSIFLLPETATRKKEIRKILLLGPIKL